MKQTKRGYLYNIDEERGTQGERQRDSQKDRRKEKK